MRGCVVALLLTLLTLLRAEPPAQEHPDVAALIAKRGWAVREIDGAPVLAPARLEPGDAAVLAVAKRLDVIDLTGVKASDADLAALAKSPRGPELWLGGDSVADSGLKALGAAASLRGVKLIDCPRVTDAGVAELARVPNLARLSLRGCRLDGSCFAAFAGSKSLKALHLEQVQGFDDVGAGHVAKLRLDALTLPEPDRSGRFSRAGLARVIDAGPPELFSFDRRMIDDAILKTLAAKGWLGDPARGGVRRLDLSESRITDPGAEALLPFAELQHLDLSGTGVTDATLRKLAGHKKLTSLRLQSCRVTAAGLEAVAGLPIESLHAGHRTLTEADFKAFSRMGRLADLNLYAAGMKSEWLKHLAGHAKLRTLYLVNTNFDDADAKQFAALPALAEVDLGGTFLGDAGFAELLKLPRLGKLGIDGTKVSEAAYREAKKQRPDLGLRHSRYDKD